jgi:hypothetical protein
MTTSTDEEAQAMITFNTATNQFEAKDAAGVVVATSPNQSYLKQKLRNLGFGSKPSPAGGYIAPTLVAPTPVPSEFTVDERFDFIERFTKGVANGSYLSLVLTGDAGIGKTHTVLNTLRNSGLKEIMPLEISPARKGEESDELIQSLLLDSAPLVDEGDFIVIRGFSTPKALYRSLFDYNGKIIVFDDCDAAFRDSNAANILKAALDNSEPRHVSWATEKRSADDDLPTRFCFTGRIVFISNMSLAQFPSAVLSRSMHVDLSLTTDEKIVRIDNILSKMDDDNGYVSDVLELIKANAPKFKELSIRTAMLLLSIRKTETDTNVFKRLALYHAMV